MPQYSIPGKTPHSPLEEKILSTSKLRLGKTRLPRSGMEISRIGLGLAHTICYPARTAGAYSTGRLSWGLLISTRPGYMLTECPRRVSVNLFGASEKRSQSLQHLACFRVLLLVPWGLRLTRYERRGRYSTS